MTLSVSLLITDSVYLMVLLKGKHIKGYFSGMF